MKSLKKFINNLQSNNLDLSRGRSEGAAGAPCLGAKVFVEKYIKIKYINNF